MFGGRQLCECHDGMYRLDLAFGCAITFCIRIVLFYSEIFGIGWRIKYLGTHGETREVLFEKYHFDENFSEVL